MANDDRRHELAKKGVVLELPGEDRVVVRKDLRYRLADRDRLTMDLYVPGGATGDEQRPAVVFVNGYPDAGAERMLGCRFKEMESFVSWGRLAAASGLVGVTYATGSDPAADLRALVRSLLEQPAAFGIDATRIGIWACSGHGPNALFLLIDSPARSAVKAAVFCYSFMLDREGSSAVATGAAAFRFVHPAVGRSVEDLPRDVPLMIVRAGQDHVAGVKDSIDLFVAEALRLNLPVTLVNHAAGPHAFDLVDDSDESRDTVRQVLRFLQFHLRR